MFLVILQIYPCRKKEEEQKVTKWDYFLPLSLSISFAPSKSLSKSISVSVSICLFVFQCVFSVFFSEFCTWSYMLFITKFYFVLQSHCFFVYPSISPFTSTLSFFCIHILYFVYVSVSVCTLSLHIFLLAVMPTRGGHWIQKKTMVKVRKGQLKVDLT